MTKAQQHQLKAEINNFVLLLGGQVPYESFLILLDVGGFMTKRWATQMRALECGFCEIHTHSVSLCEILFTFLLTCVAFRKGIIDYFVKTS